MKIQLRIINDPQPRSAPFNMAADLYLLDQCENAESLYVRFHKWEKPSITIGYSQKASELLDLEYVRSQGAVWIRRPTGGRAVLHHEDITYSVIFPRSIKSMGTTIAQSYRIISRCLISGLRTAGIDCSAHDSFDQLKEVRRETKLPCFLAPNREEIMVDRKKLVGSAQKRTSLTVLQHGSIPLTDAYRELPWYEHISSEEKEVQCRLLQAKSTCIKEVLPLYDEKALINGLVRGFIEELPFKPHIAFWNSEELSQIESLTSSREFQNRWLRDTFPILDKKGTIE